jgi:hypothetical protein
MKKQLLFITLLLPLFATAQNVGIGTSTPANKLTVNGNLVVTQATTATNTPPTVAQTKTMVNASIYNYTAADSTGRFYDPGGPSGNYLANLTSQIGVSAGGNAGILVVIESIELGTGDSLIITDFYGNRVMSVSNGYNITGTYTFSSRVIVFNFKSNGDAAVGAGFSILWKQLDGIPQPEPANYSSNAFYFDVNKGAIRSGNIVSGTVGRYSVGLGFQNTASADYSVAIGQLETASGGAGSVAMGYSNYATGSAGVTSIGYGNTASGSAGATAIGYSNIASGSNGSTALGFQSIASGEVGSTAIGSHCNASGITSFALGANANAIGAYSVAIGNNPIASGNNAVAIGFNTARANSSMAIGYYNDSIASSNPTSIVPTDPLLYVGNGFTSTLRHNAAVIYKNGNADLNGYVRLGESTDGSPRIKIKKLTVNVPAAQGGFNLVAHGLTASKILAISGLCTVAGFKILPNHLQAGFQYTLNVDNGNIAVGAVPGSSASILNAPVVILVTYEE